MPERDDDIYRALADRHRRRIVAALCRGPMVAGELGRLVGLAPNAVSFHLKVLQATNLVTVRREGRFLRYHANASTLARWRSRADELFGEVADGSLTDVDEAELVSASSTTGPSADVESPSPDADESGEVPNWDLPTELL